MKEGTYSHEKAQKHIELSLKVRDIARERLPDHLVYVATHTAGKYGQLYQSLEEETGEEFWSLRIISDPTKRRLKDPDLLIAIESRAEFLVEIKWGVIAGEGKSDMIDAFQIQSEMRNALIKPAICQLRGPAVTKGQRYRTDSFKIKRKYTVDHNTKLLLVTDFASIKRILPNRFLEFKNQMKSSDFVIAADIKDRIEGIPSVRDVLCRYAVCQGSPKFSDG